MQKNSGDSKRAVDTYTEALKVNPYLWEAFEGLLELGMVVNLLILNLVGVSLKVESCFKTTSPMRALRETTHTTNIDAASLDTNSTNFTLLDIPETVKPTLNSTFQPIFNWGKPQTFPNRLNQPISPRHAFSFLPSDLSTPTMQVVNPSSLLSEESPISALLETMKPRQRPPSRSALEAPRGKNALRPARETVQVWSPNENEY